MIDDGTTTITRATTIRRTIATTTATATATATTITITIEAVEAVGRS